MASSGTGNDISTPVTEGPDRIPAITNISMEFLLINPAVNNSRLSIQVLIDAGNPPGLLVWKHNGSLVSSRTNPRVNILAGGGLTVRNVIFSASGMYTVSVSNLLGESIKKFQVLFPCKPWLCYTCYISYLVRLKKRLLIKKGLTNTISPHICYIPIISHH